MKASLLARAAPALLLAGVLAAGPARTAMAQAGGSTAAPTAAGAPPAATTAPMATGTPSASAPSMESHGGSAAPATAGSAKGAATARHPASPGRQAGNAKRDSVEQRITDLHARLHITPAQSGHWDAFAQVMRNNASSMDRAYRERAGHMTSMSALQDLESYARLEQARAQDVERLVPVFRTLYDSMSASQKKDADQLFRTYARQHGPHGKTTAR